MPARTGSHGACAICRRPARHAYGSQRAFDAPSAFAQPLLKPAVITILFIAINPYITSANAIFLFMPIDMRKSQHRQAPCRRHKRFRAAQKPQAVARPFLVSKHAAAGEAVNAPGLSPWACSFCLPLLRVPCFRRRWSRQPWGLAALPAPAARSSRRLQPPAYACAALRHVPKMVRRSPAHLVLHAFCPSRPFSRCCLSYVTCTPHPAF